MRFLARVTCFLCAIVVAGPLAAQRLVTRIFVDFLAVGA